MMTQKYPLPDIIYPIQGIKIGITQAKVRYENRDDLTIFELNSNANTALVTTQSTFAAAPVQLAKDYITKNNPRYLLINTGNANAATGIDGIECAKNTCQSLANLTKVGVEQVLPFSTGVIGETLPDNNIIKALPDALNNLNENHWEKASSAIMTTDTTKKIASQAIKLEYHGQKIHYHATGIAKGAGMIRPNMATMLAFVATDAHIEQALLQVMLKKLTDKSFNRITIDGDTSTNDCCILIATGKSDNAPLISDEQHPHYLPLYQMLEQIFVNLAQMIVKDGEGATKFITVTVKGGKTSEDCAKVAYSVAHSPLVKTAFFASDPNWGRILAAVGKAGVTLSQDKVNVYLDEVMICQRGGLADGYTEDKGQAIMKRPQITIAIDLGQGKASDTVYTCDLSYDYVKINADYRS